MQGLRQSRLLILLSFSGPFNLVSGGFLTAPSLISNCSNLPFGTQLREGHGGWSLAYKKRGTKSFRAREPQQGPTWFQINSQTSLDTVLTMMVLL